jgi:uncharacterized membrane protein
MRSVVRLVGPVCLVFGVLLLVDAVATGAAHLFLVVVVPVLTGTGPLFLLSLVLVVVGFLFLPLAFVGEGLPAAPVGPTGAATPEPVDDRGASGGMILVGPVPIFFGAWRRNPPISYRWALLLGLVLAAVAVLLLWGLAVL